MLFNSLIILLLASLTLCSPIVTPEIPSIDPITTPEIPSIDSIETPEIPNVDDVLKQCSEYTGVEMFAEYYVDNIEVFDLDYLDPNLNATSPGSINCDAKLHPQEIINFYRKSFTKQDCTCSCYFNYRPSLTFRSAVQNSKRFKCCLLIADPMHRVDLPLDTKIHLKVRQAALEVMPFLEMLFFSSRDILEYTIPQLQDHIAYNLLEKASQLMGVHANGSVYADADIPKLKHDYIKVGNFPPTQYEIVNFYKTFDNGLIVPLIR